METFTDVHQVTPLELLEAEICQGGGWAIHGDPTGTLTFVDPTGRTIIAAPPTDAANGRVNTST